MALDRTEAPREAQKRARGSAGGRRWALRPALAALLGLGVVLLAGVAAYPAAGPAVASRDGAGAAEDAEDATAALDRDALLWLLSRRRPLPPEAPAPPIVTPASDASLNIAWSAPPGASDIVDYDLQYRAAGAGAFVDWPHAGTDTRATVSGLAADTAYEARVRAANDAGAGDWSEPGAGSTAAARPAFVEGARARREIDENSAPGAAVGAPLRALRATHYALAGADAAAFRIDAADGQLRTREGVAYDHERRPEYAVTVTAHGPGAPDDAARIAVTIAVRDVDEPPAAPPAPTLTAASSTRLTVAWTAPANSGPPVTDYDLQYRAFGADFVDVTHEGAATAARIDGLRRGTRYEARVRASNAEGMGPWSARGSGRTSGSGGGSGAGAGSGGTGGSDGGGTGASDSGGGSGGSDSGGSGSGGDTGGDGPDPTTNARPVFDGPSSLSVPENVALVGTVRANDPDAGDEITGFTVVDRADGALFEVSATGALSFREPPDFERPADTYNAHPESAAGDNRYVLDVQAHSGAGARASSATRTLAVAVTNVAEPPDRPDPPAVRRSTQDSLEIHWRAPRNRGPPITGYGYRYRAPGSGQDWTAARVAAAVTEATLSGLAQRTDFEVQVRAGNAEGTGPWSASATGTTEENLAPTFDDGASARRAVAENAPGGRDMGEPVRATDDDGGTLVYSLEGTDAASFAIVADSGQLRAIDEAGYDHETRPHLTVTARVVDGQGGSATIAVTVDVTDAREPPEAPSAPAVTAVSDIVVAVTWTAPANSGPAIEDYDYRYRPATSGAHWIEVLGVAVSPTAVTIGGLTPETDYEVQVRATNDEGTGAWSPSGRGATGPSGPNRSPEAVGQIASRTLPAGGSETLDVSSRFSDPDHDELAYAAASSDTSVATAAASGSAVTVTAVTSGEAVVTVTASDPGGLTAEQRMAVTVAAGNRAPIATETIPDQTIHVWGELQILPSSRNRFVVRGMYNYFSDPDGDPLHYAASSSDERYVTARTSIIPALDHYQMIVDPVAVGQATITFTASDPEGLSANYVFGVNVSPPIPNRRPVVQWPIGARQVYVGVPDVLRFRDHFRDEDVYGSYFQLNYAVSSADNGIALVRVWDKRDHETGHGYARLVIEGVSAGETTATVVATDRAGLSVEETFDVIVRTRPPKVTRRISDVLVSAGVETYVWDLNSYFTDPDGYDLVYDASSSDTVVVHATISRHGPYVVLRAGEVGTADITVTATDVTGLTASQTFTVTVSAAPSVPRSAPGSGRPPSARAVQSAVAPVTESDHGPVPSALPARTCTS